MRRTKESAALIVAEDGGAIAKSSAEHNPAQLYLASLAPAGCRTMAARLRVTAQLMGGDPSSVDWSALRFEHVIALRSLF